MPVRVVDICPCCGRRNESPDLGPDDLRVIALMEERVAAGMANPNCADCQKIKKGDGTAAGEARARANRPS